MIAIPRLAFGLWPGALSGFFALLVGAALGPHGLGMLSPAVLSFVDPAMPAALVALGLVTGLGIRGRRAGERGLVAAASAEAAVTVALVFGGMLFVAPEWSAAGALPYWFPALVLGICAASSSTLVRARDGASGAVTARIAHLDDLLPVVVGGIALALLQQPSAGAALLLTAQACAVALVISGAGWLLLAKSTSETEQRVFAVALLLLLGGAADYLSLSALLSGLVAGLFLEAAGGQARDSVRRDILHVQHPLVVLVLVVIGARIDLSLPWLGLAGAYLFLRTAGKYAGGWIAGRMALARVPRDIGLSLLSPGVVGLAYALNVLRAAGEAEASPMLAIVAVGAIGSDVISSLVRPPDDAS